MPLPPPKVVRKIKVPISVCVIAKNERKNLPEFHRRLQPILGHPDDELIMVDTGSNDATPIEAQRRGWRVVHYPEVCSLDYRELAKQYLPGFDHSALTKHGHYAGRLIRSFAEARQKSFDAAKNEVCLWLDLDDELLNPGYLRPYIDKCYGEGSKGVIMLPYDYAHDEDGQCITTLWRERVVSKSCFEWKGACHETLCPKDGMEGLHLARHPEFPTRVKHRSPKPHGFSDLRNYLILRHSLETEDYKDPRTIFYLGNACRGLARNQEAVEWYMRFVGQSGSRDDILSARLSACACLIRDERPWAALAQALEAQRVMPSDPRVYYFQAECWYNMMHYQNCLAALKLGDTFPMPDTLHAVDPTTLGFHPSVLGARAARELGEEDLAVMFAERAVRERPSLELARRGLEDMQQWARAEKMTKWQVAAVQSSKDQIKAAQLMKFSPHALSKGIGSPEEELPGDQDKPQVAFYCGHSGERWGPSSIKGGIGASEKMVYEVARALAARGFNVAVYCSLPTEGGEETKDGVHWRFTAKFNPRLHRDHLVIWRMPQIVDKMPFNADRIYVWMHDMGHNSVWTPEILALTDKVLFLSRWQRSLHPAVPEEKVFYTRNGVDLAAHLYDGREKKKRLFFCSSPDRGWQTTIRLFLASDLPKQGWELHMFYGFGATWRKWANDAEYGHIVEQDRSRRYHEYEDECKAMCQGPVKYRGRVGWRQMAEEMKESAAWLYPTRFGEISCVAAMEAMAAGCWCVATDSAALKETLAGYDGWRNLSGYLPQNWPGAVSNIQVPSPGAAARWAEHARRFDINTLAQQWAEELFSESEGRVAADAPADGAGQAGG